MRDPVLHTPFRPPASSGSVIVEVRNVCRQVLQVLLICPSTGFFQVITNHGLEKVSRRNAMLNIAPDGQQHVVPNVESVPHIGCISGNHDAPPSGVFDSTSAS